MNLDIIKTKLNIEQQTYDTETRTHSNAIRNSTMFYINTNNNSSAKCTDSCVIFQYT